MVSDLWELFHFVLRRNSQGTYYDPCLRNKERQAQRVLKHSDCRARVAVLDFMSHFPLHLVSEAPGERVHVKRLAQRMSALLTKSQVIPTNVLRTKLSSQISLTSSKGWPN